MTGTVPTDDGYYRDRDGDVWECERGIFRCSHASDGYDPLDPRDLATLESWGPYQRVVSFTDEELAAVHDIAGQIHDAVHLNATGMQRHGVDTAALTAELAAADIWRAIAEKTGER